MENTAYTATTTRSVTFAVTDSRTRVVGNITRLPAGTTVYARQLGASGMWRIRVAGTLLTQDVRPATFNLS